MDLRKVNLDRNLYPLKIQAFNEINDIVWERTVEQPEIVEVPALHQIYKTKIRIRIHFADGTHTDSFYH
jgi:hypothetical protein